MLMRFAVAATVFLLTASCSASSGQGRSTPTPTRDSAPGQLTPPPLAPARVVGNTYSLQAPEGWTPHVVAQGDRVVLTGTCGQQMMVAEGPQPVRRSTDVLAAVRAYIEAHSRPGHAASEPTPGPSLGGAPSVQFSWNRSELVDTAIYNGSMFRLTGDINAPKCGGTVDAFSAVASSWMWIM